MLEQEFISINDTARWDKILSHLPHGPAHTARYNRAMMASTKRQTFLYVAQSSQFLAVCPVAKRMKFETNDLVTPYGFGGFISQGDHENFQASFDDFMQKNQILSSYLAVHPVFCQSQSVLKLCERVASAVYLINLENDLNLIFQRLNKTHRYEIRKMQNAEIMLLNSAEEVEQHLLPLYSETLLRTDAAEVYHFKQNTFAEILAGDKWFGLAAIKDGKIVAITLVIYSQHMADYFINAASQDGRDYARILLWTAIEKLHALGVPFFNLGGGVKPNDSLEQFKRRFAGDRIEPSVLKRIYNQDLYRDVCMRSNVEINKTTYFPAYHAVSS